MFFFAATPDVVYKTRELFYQERCSLAPVVETLMRQYGFITEGDLYKRMPVEPPEDLPASLREAYKRKNIYFVRNRNTDNMLKSPQLLDELRSIFEKLAPVYRFLWRASM